MPPLLTALLTALLAALPAALLPSMALASAPADPDWHIPLAPDDSSEPDHPAYRSLRQTLDHYRTLQTAGSWPTVPPGAPLEGGMRDPRVVTLRDRLRATSDFDADVGADAWFFDARLHDAVKRFQLRHGLPATGVVDDRTLSATNLPVADRIAQLETTLERWRWLPRQLEPRYVWVNVAGGTLELVEHGTTVLAMRVIAGHPDRPTPSFRSTIRAVVFNPPWSVPRRIAIEDLLPTQQADASFLKRLDIRVFTGDGSDNTGREVDPAGIDWRALSADHFPYRLRQDPGPLNSLGRFKFVIDNPWDIYLHDTPSRRLFDLSSRTLSSGCVRLEAPEKLVERLLADNPDAQMRDTEALLAEGRTRTVQIAEPVPVYVVYLTAWVTPEGVVHFRPDVYGRDARLR